MTKTIALVGNPNTGKTTLFNTITKGNEHVGNWHGVTVDCKEKKLKHASGEQFVVADLPGMYSVCSYSFEEAVARDYLQKTDCRIINICDISNLQRNLLLTLQLIEMGYSITLCINNHSKKAKNCKQIDAKKLEKLLGIKVFVINAQSKKQVEKVVDFALQNDTKSQTSKLPYLKNLLNFFDVNFADQKKLESTQKIKILEQDEYYFNNLKLQKSDILLAKLQKFDTIEKVNQARYCFVESVCKQCVRAGEQGLYGFAKLDKVLLNKWLALPIFFAIVGIVFALTFGSVGSGLSGWLSTSFSKLVFTPLANFVKANTSNAFVVDFICSAVFGGFLNLVSFMPQICLMFLGLFVLEDSGYMARLAFVVEDFLSKIGLSGKSVFTLLMGFGCGTTATLTCRNLENKNSKIKTALLAPYISCSAKLPLYAIVCNAFFPSLKFVVVALLYLLGVSVAMLVCFFVNKTVLKSGKQSFIMELPELRAPNPLRLVKNIWSNIVAFVSRVGSVLLVFSCIIWICQNCNFKLQYGQGDSILQTVAKFIAPVFAPLGFGSYGAAACLLCGFVAKEIIASTIGLINGCGVDGGIDKISQSLLLQSSAFCLTLPSSLSFLVFSLLYVPCVSNVGVLVKEIGGKWTAFACALQFAISYVLSFVVYKIALYFEHFGVVAGLLSVAAFVLIVAVLLKFAAMLKKKKMCSGCAGCGRGCK